MSINTHVTLFVRQDGRCGLRADLDVTLPGVAGTDLNELIAEAKRICAYTNAVTGNVETTFVVNGGR